MGVRTGRQRPGLVMSAEALRRALKSIADQIRQRHPRPAQLVLVGVQTRGVPLARRIAQLVAKASGETPAVGALDITLYRDDLTTIAAQPVIKGTQIPVPIDGRQVVIVDDVLFTGRTSRAALDELMDFGRPSRIELAVVVDRGHRELPIQPDYVGRKLATGRRQIVHVRVQEEDGEDGVALSGRSGP